MTKPRIIIADVDVNYIIPLQLKFAEEFFGKVDLEIITDKTFFDEMFAIPQSVDILIVSEELYDQSLQRHNITNIFLMTEQNDEEKPNEWNINPIFKYTSIKEIFNEITGKSADIFNLNITAKKETRIIVVYSACGGVGKTTVAMGISSCLARSYKKVLYINAGYLQTFQRLLDNETPIATSDVYARLVEASDDIYAEIKHVIRKEHFSYLPPFKASLISLGIDYSVYEKIILSAKRSADYDYIVVDTDSTFDEDKACLLGIADRVVVVTGQNAFAVYATNILISNVTGINSEKYVFVCNNFKKDRDNALLSPTLTTKFTVSDYIEHYECYDRMKCFDFVSNKGIQKIAFLVM